MDRRNWIDRDRMVSLNRESKGRVRARVVLLRFKGLRECEVLRQKVRDLTFALHRPTLTVRGKGRFGGRFRSIPMDPMTRADLAK